MADIYLSIAIFLLGFIGGIFFYSKVLDKPETQVNGSIKQKKGVFTNLFKRRER